MSVVDKTYPKAELWESSTRIGKIAILADRIGWEERQLLLAAKAREISAFWLDDGRMCAGLDTPQVDADCAVLVRSKSFVRGPLLAEMLEGAGVTVFNSARAAELCSQKLKTLRLLHAAGVPTVPFRLVLTRDDLDLAIERLDLPLVLKPLTGGFGRCVLQGRDADLLHSVYDYVEHHARGFERALLAQPLMRGRDIRLVAVRGRVVAAISRVPDQDWRANLAIGAGAEVMPVDAELAELAARVSDRLDLSFAGIDLFRADDGYLLSEVNHVPEFRGASEVAGRDLAAEMVDAVLAEPA